MKKKIFKTKIIIFAAVFTLSIILVSCDNYHNTSSNSLLNSTSSETISEHESDIAEKILFIKI